MEKLNFVVLMQEDHFDSHESRIKAGFSAETDPEEYFEVFAEIEFVEKSITIINLKLFSIQKDKMGIRRGLNDISDLITEDIKRSIKIHIIENEL